jgi:ADP-ribose pyrophosphatase YjhB (NUDIX family)
MSEYPILTVTCVVECEGEYLLIKRALTEKNYPGYWAFPGGRPHIGETVIDAIRREVKEETGLEVLDQGCFLNGYFFKSVIGIAFLVRVGSKNVSLNSEATEHTWVSSVEQMQKMDCIEGVCNHLADAIRMRSQNKLVSLEEMNLTVDKYINR